MSGPDATSFTDEMLTRCEEIMREVCTDFEAELKQFNGEQDHVHLLVHYPPKVQLSKLVNSLKGVSARLLRKEYDAHVRRYLWGRTLLVRLVLRRKLRRGAADRRTAVHQAAAAPRGLRYTVPTRTHVRVRAGLRWPSPPP